MEKATVHQFKVWDPELDEYLFPPLKSTVERIKEIGGEIITGTAEEVDASKIDKEGKYHPSKR